MQSTTHDGWGTRDSLPIRESRGSKAHVQVATRVVVVDVLYGPRSAVLLTLAVWRSSLMALSGGLWLARELVGVLLCSHSSQSSSGTGWVYSACGGMLVDAPD